MGQVADLDIHITAQPSSQPILAGQSAYFTAAASSIPPPSIQWQVSTDNGSTFTNIAEATATSYALTATLEDHGKQFRAVFTTKWAAATTAAATLTIVANDITLVVVPSDPNWFAFTPPGTAAEITGSNPRGGNGSLELVTGIGASAAYIYETPLSAVQTVGALRTLAFDWFIDPASHVAFPPTIALRVFAAGDPRSFFLSGESCCVLHPTGSWQTTNLMGRLSIEAADGNPPPASLAAIPPDAPIVGIQIRGSFGSGMPWFGFVDNVTIGFSSATRFNFELASPAATRIRPTITWNPAPLAGGSPLTPAQLNATADAEGQFTYAPAAGAILTSGFHTLTTSFVPDDPSKYLPIAKVVALPVSGTRIARPGDGSWFPLVSDGSAVGVTATRPRSGTGSLELQRTPNGYSVLIYEVHGVAFGKVSDLTTLSYDWFSEPGGPAVQPPEIALRVYPYGDPRSFFLNWDTCSPIDPCDSHPTGVWQSTNLIGRLSIQAAEGTPPASLSDIPADAPIVGIHIRGSFSSGAPTLGFVDNVAIGFGGATPIVYNFEPVTSALSVADAFGQVGGTTTLRATLTDAGAPVAGQTILFALNGFLVGSETTDGSGLAMLSGVSLAGVSSGTHIAAVGAYFLGSSSVAPASGSAALVVTDPLSVTVTAPNGGNKLFVNVPTTIGWSATGIPASIDVQLSRNAGPFVAIAACTGLRGSLTTCAWTPTQAGNNSRIRVIARGAAGATAADDSDLVFQIAGAVPSLTVTTPNSALSWTEGTTQTIRWSHNLGANAFMRVEASRDAGASWALITSSVQNTTATQGALPWLVTGLSTSALVRVTSIDTPATDNSDMAFGIVAPMIAVTQPNALSTTWRAGANQNIRFSHNLGTGQPIRLDLSMDGGATWTVMSSISPFTTTNATSGVVPWRVSGPPTTHARIRATWNVNPEATDTSDADFTIQSRVLVSETLNPSNPWAAGSIRTIAWTQNLPSGQTVDIAFSPDNGATWIPVASGVPNMGTTTGIYTGPLPAVPTTQGRIRVSWSADPDQSDVNNVPFTLADPFVRVVAPNNNQLWTLGSDRLIRWAHNLGVGDTVIIELSRDDGATWETIEPLVDKPNSSASAGSYIWQGVTLPATAGAIGRIRVRWTADRNVLDTSDVGFRIQ